MSASCLISADNISVIRQNKAILHDISLRVQERDFISIIGPNGAGKSMLLKCLMGIFSPTKGSVKRRAQLRIGYVPQNFISEAIIPITTGDFLRLGKNTSAMRISEVADECGIEKTLHTPLAHLSGGERQRVLLARSLLDAPDLLMLDEPEQNLDVVGQLAFYKLLERIYQTHSLSILMVSHNLHMVMATTKKVICLFHHICCSGAPYVVRRDPEFISLFGDDMAALMAVYQHGHDHEHDHGHDHDKLHAE